LDCATQILRQNLFNENYEENQNIHFQTSLCFQHKAIFFNFRCYRGDISKHRKNFHKYLNSFHHTFIITMSLLKVIVILLHWLGTRSWTLFIFLTKPSRIEYIIFFPESVLYGLAYHRVRSLFLSLIGCDRDVDVVDNLKSFKNFFLHTMFLYVILKHLKCSVKIFIMLVFDYFSTRLVRKQRNRSI